MDSKANLAKIYAEELAHCQLFCPQFLLLAAPSGPCLSGNEGQRLSWKMWPVGQLYLHQEEPVGAEDVLTPAGMEK